MLVLHLVAKAVTALYGIVSGIDDYLDRHIEDMKASSRPIIERTAGGAVQQAIDGGKEVVPRTRSGPPEEVSRHLKLPR